MMAGEGNWIVTGQDGTLLYQGFSDRGGYIQRSASEGQPMKLWLLKVNANLDDWNVGSDKESYCADSDSSAFVLRAPAEEDARRMAAEEASFGNLGAKWWLDPHKTACVEITADGPAEVLVGAWVTG